MNRRLFILLTSIAVLTFLLFGNSLLLVAQALSSLTTERAHTALLDFKKHDYQGAVQQGGNLIPNSSFEVPDPGNSSLPLSWTPVGQCAIWDGTTSHSGTYSVSASSGNCGGTWSTGISIDPADYTFSIWYKNGPNCNNNSVVLMGHEANGVVIFSTTVEFNCSSIWTQGVATISLSQVQSISSLTVILFGGINNTWWDDIEIMAQSPPTTPTYTPTNTPTNTPTFTSSPTSTDTSTPIPPTATFTRTPVPPTATFTDTPIPLTPMPTNTLVPLITVDKGEGAEYVRDEEVVVCFNLPVAKKIKLQLLPKIGLLDKRYDYLGIDQTDKPTRSGCWPSTIDYSWIPGRQEVRLLILDDNGGTTVTESTWFTYKVDTDPVCESPDNWLIRQEWYENLIDWDTRLDKERPLPLVKKAVTSSSTTTAKGMLKLIKPLRETIEVLNLLRVAVTDIYTFVTASETAYDEYIDELRLRLRGVIEYAKVGEKWSVDGERFCVGSTAQVYPPPPKHPYLEAAVDQFSGGYEQLIDEINNDSDSASPTSLLNIPKPEFLVLSFGSFVTSDVQSASQNATFGMYFASPEGDTIGIDPSTGNTVNTFSDAVFYESDTEQIMVISAPILGSYSLKLDSSFDSEYQLSVISIVGDAEYEAKENVKLVAGQQKDQSIKLVEFGNIYLPLIWHNQH